MPDGFNLLVFKKSNEDEPVNGALRDFGELLAFKIGIFRLERLGEHFAVAVQFNKKRFV
ncbi:MAG TPA: hypothetical protein VGI63_08645 [Verrucomicrobiae bacterium]